MTIGPDTIAVVSGLPRSGTSMMMQMLEAGGMVILTDRIRVADEDNRKGYYEYEKVKSLKSDQNWLADASGKVVKIISELLKYLPGSYTYKIVFMERDILEVLASQDQMLLRRGIEAAGEVDNSQIAQIFEKHLAETRSWLEQKPSMETLYINHNDVLGSPLIQAESINEFLGNSMDVVRMASVIDRGLYRQRG
ncbi:MAG TPA: sulfotransferase family protein [Candidatus Latescibacteria bacterium]|nr:sulfotransferase family protein [Gemmatimonadota bacterium]HCR19679.1 sulfotransferase family protein [Candidatus Latescibacterota bacterium]|tara:strand:- start:6712 stop:7293 length:582 start_codon:yes stop_codon:yes gene_type:complete